MSRHTNVRLPDSLVTLIDELARASGTTDEVPVLSQSALIRTMLHDSASRLLEGDLDAGDLEEIGVDGGDLLELVPEHTRILYRREAFKDGEAQLRNLRTGFEARVKRHFKSRFKGGFRNEQLDEWSVNMKMDAQILFPPEAGAPDEDPHEDRREECLAYVSALVEEAKAAADASDYDPLDPEEMFANYGGVEAGVEQEERETAEEQAERVAVDVLGRFGLTPSGSPDVRVSEFADTVYNRTDGDVDYDLAGSVARRVYSETEQSSAPTVTTSRTDGGVDRGDGPRTDGGRPTPGSEGYWEALGDEQETRADGAGPSMLDLIEESLEADEAVHAVTVTGEADGTLYLLVVRTGEHEGDLMLKERYFAVDLEEGEGYWMGNGINRRVTGEFDAFATAMVRAYARVQQVAKSGDAPAEPLLSDAVEGRNSAVEHRLKRPIGSSTIPDKADEADAPSADRRHLYEEPEDPDDGRSAAAATSPEPSGGVQPTWVVCEECESKAKRADCVNIGGALGEDVWVHREACEEQADAE